MTSSQPRTLFFALAVSFAAATTHAQDPAPKPRSQVKSEARDAVKSGSLPNTELPEVTTKPSTRVNKSRTQVKSETRASPRVPAGEAEVPAVTPPSTSNRTRAQRKAETRAAAKAGQLTPAGEDVDPTKK